MSAVLHQRAPQAHAHRPDLVSRLMADGAYAAALSLLRASLISGAVGPDTLDQAATCHWHLENAHSALDLMQQLVDGWPQLASPCVKLASYAASCGQSDRALAALDTAFDRGGRSAQALTLLNRLQPVARNSATARRLKRIADTQSASERDRSLAMNTLGHIDHRAGRTQAAFRWFTACNRTFGPRFDKRHLSLLVAGQLLRFDPDLLPDGPVAHPRMLFITGMPRSGTTVVEHALAQHPGVRALGENPALSKTVAALRRRAQAGQPWAWYARLSDLDAEKMRRHFFRYLPSDAEQDTRVLVFKMPFDCFEMAAVKLLWPGAKILHMRRHPLDTGLSNFNTMFHAGHGYARRLEWIAQMIRATERSVADYQSKLGPDLRQQSYRAFVEAPETQLRDILAHANLPWDARCLQPGTGHRAVRTASIGKINAGISKDGLHIWKRYRAHLTPLIDALGGMDQIAAWDDDQARFTA